MTTPNTNLLSSISGRVRRLDRLFVLLVVLPTVLSILYFGLLASDVYISESRFVVRSPQKQANTGLGALLQSAAGFSRAQDDSYAVQDYMLSRDALTRLDEALALGKTFGDSSVDRISRFGGLDFDTSFEALHRYYQNKVTVQLDGASSIATLTVRAFSADHAQAINRKLLDLGEQLVNGLNARGRQDMIQFAQNEVAEAERKAKSAALALSSYRSEKGVIDPERQSTIQLQQIGKLQDELIATKIQLAQVSSLSKDNPQVQSLNKRVQSLQDEIDRENARITGGRTSLAGKAADFQRFALDREFADKQLAIALSSLENARNEAQRKQLYLERIVQPSRPDVATEPRRLRAVVATLLISLVLWGIVSLLVAGAREHRD